MRVFVHLNVSGVYVCVCFFDSMYVCMSVRLCLFVGPYVCMGVCMRVFV